MDLRQLECFVTVTDEGSFTLAAERLGLSQPGVSTLVRNLEREVGEPLLHRAGRGGVRLTAAGEAALPAARTALAAATRVRTSVEDLTGLLRGRVALGHVSAGASATLLGPLLAFHEAHPEVEVSLVEDRSERLLDGVLDGSLDLAWVGTTGALPHGVGHRTVVDERLVVGVPADHRWAARRSVSFAEAVRVPLVAMPRGTGARSAFDAACRTNRLTAEIAFECSSPELIGQLTACGVGVAVLPGPLAMILGLTPVPLAKPATRSRIALCWKASGTMPPAARAFLHTVASA